MASNPSLSVAGLWDNWTNRESGEAIRSCTMIVTEANPFMSEIHDRMPVFLPPDGLDAWLTCKGVRKSSNPPQRASLRLGRYRGG
jgi:putative SOS response-associated peptidase YedK